MALVQVERPRHTSSNGGSSEPEMQETEHLPLHLPTEHWLSLQRQRLEIMVEKAKGLLPQWAGPVLLGAAFSAAAFLYSDVRGGQKEQMEAIRALREDIIVLKTQKEASDRQREKEEKENREERDMNRLWRENLDKQMTRLELRTGR